MVNPIYLVELLLNNVQNSLGGFAVPERRPFPWVPFPCKNFFYTFLDFVRVCSHQSVGPLRKRNGALRIPAELQTRNIQYGVSSWIPPESVSTYLAFATRPAKER